MNRLHEVIDFIEYDSKKNFMIEPSARDQAIEERIFDVINNYKPEVIVKAGIGSGRILKNLSAKSDAYIVVVEPSLKLIKKFLDENSETDVKFINGEFHEFPVDYYASNLLICIDYLNFLDSVLAAAEFKRAIKFDGIFFYAGVVLHENDIDGVYDDFTKKVFPLHNDYYLSGDLKTFFELKEFSHIKSMHLEFDSNLQTQISYFKEKYPDINDVEINDFIKTHQKEFNDIFGMNENYDINEAFYIGLYMRLKPKSGEQLG